MTEQLKSLTIDIEKGIYLVNGVEIPKKSRYLKLEFENGEWSLTIIEGKSYSSRRKLPRKKL